MFRIPKSEAKRVLSNPSEKIHDLCNIQIHLQLDGNAQVTTVLFQEHADEANEFPNVTYKYLCKPKTKDWFNECKINDKFSECIEMNDHAHYINKVDFVRTSDLYPLLEQFKVKSKEEKVMDLLKEIKDVLTLLLSK